MMANKKPKGISPDEDQVKFIIKKRSKDRLDHIAWFKRKGKIEIRQEAVEMYLEANKDIPEKE